MNSSTKIKSFNFFSSMNDKPAQNGTRTSKVYQMWLDSRSDYFYFCQDLTNDFVIPLCLRDLVVEKRLSISENFQIVTSHIPIK